MRIFLGPRDIAGQIPLLAKGFRSLGCDVTTCCYENAQYKYNPDLKYDMFIQPGDMHQVNKIIEEHDVFMFLYGTSLLPDNRDFKILRKAGKKIISFCLGSDIRSWHAFEQQFALNVVEKENFPTGSLIYTLQASATLRRAELYADLILSLPNQSSLALRPYNNAFIAIDIPKFKFNVPERDVPMVVHAPTNRGMKGTDLILKALNELKQEGVNFELRLMEGYQNNQVLDILSDADCAIDQAILGFGLFSAEAMASGCAVAGAYYPHLEAIETLRPAQGLHINTLKENLRTLLVNKDLRIKLAHEGRAFVKKYHDAPNVCKRVIEALEAGNEREYDYWPTFYSTKFLLPENLVLPASIKSMGDSVVRHWGLPKIADPLDMVQRGLLSKTILRSSVPKWQDTPPDCARYKGESAKARVAPGALPTPSLLQDILVAVQGKYDLLKLYPLLKKDYFLREYIDSGNMPGALISLINIYLQHIQAGDQDSDREETVPYICIAGLLLYTHAKQLEDLVSKEIIEKISSIGITEEFLLKSFTASGSFSLISWLIAFYYLEQGNKMQAFPLFKKILEGFPPPVNISMALDSHSSECSYCVSWDLQNAQGIQHISPAAILPDWCIQAKTGVQWQVLMFICLAQGLKITIPQRVGLTENQRIFFEELLRSNGRNVSILESNV